MQSDKKIAACRLGTSLTLIGLLASTSSGQVITEDIRLAAPGISADNQFGFAVALEGDLVVVGANRDNAPQTDSGAVYVFDGASGQFRARVTGNDTSAENFFGDAVSVSGGRFFVGAPGNETSGFQAGAFYGFDGDSLQQTVRLAPFRSVFVGESPDFGFYGFSIDVDEQLIVVGAPGDVEGANGGGGAVYIYNATDQSLVGKFFADDAAFADNMGRTVATTDGFAIAASPFDDSAVQDTGAIYIFDGQTGDQVRKISYPGSDASALFGLALAADDGIVVVGARFADFVGQNSGAAFVYDVQTGALLHTLLSPHIAPSDFFGSSVAVDGDRIVVGARGVRDQGDFAGAAYVFDRNTGEQIATLLASDGEAGDVFGSSVGVSGTTVLVGAPGKSDAGLAAGAAYVFTVDIDGSVCTADANDDGIVNVLDVVAFITIWNAQGSGSDLNGDGIISILDVVGFITEWNAGCP